MIRRAIWLVLAFMAFAPVHAQVFPEYGAIIKHGAKPGPFRFPTVPMPQARQPAGKEPIGDIAFVHRGDIYTVTLDGKYVRRLTTDGRNAFPIWSPNGRYIAFSKAVLAKGEFSSAVLYIITTDGKYSRALTKSQTGRAVYPAAWLPDGKGLVVGIHWLDSDVGPELRVVMLDGKPSAMYQKWRKAGDKAGFLHEPASRDLYEFTPGQAAAFSPDGKNVMLTASTEQFVDSPRLDLYRMGIDGSQIRRLSLMPRGWIKCLRWHPKSPKVLTAEEHHPEGAEDYAGIWLRSLDGKILKKLEDAPTASVSGIDWSPAGDHIIFQRMDAGYRNLQYPGIFAEMSSHSSIWVMKADGSGKYKLADDACHPNWR